MVGGGAAVARAAALAFRPAVVEPRIPQSMKVAPVGCVASTKPGASSFLFPVGKDTGRCSARGTDLPALELGAALAAVGGRRDGSGKGPGRGIGIGTGIRMTVPAASGACTIP